MDSFCCWRITSATTSPAWTLRTATSTSPLTRRLPCGPSSSQAVFRHARSALTRILIKKDGWRVEWLLANFDQQLNALGGTSDGDRFMEDAVGETAEKLTKQSTDIKAAKEVSLPLPM